LTKKNN